MQLHSSELLQFLAFVLGRERNGNLWFARIERSVCVVDAVQLLPFVEKSGRRQLVLRQTIRGSTVFSVNFLSLQLMLDCINGLPRQTIQRVNVFLGHVLLRVQEFESIRFKRRSISNYPLIKIVVKHNSDMVYVSLRALVFVLIVVSGLHI
jgi:hypothetical protein